MVASLLPRFASPIDLITSLSTLGKISIKLETSSSVIGTGGGC